MAFLLLAEGAAANQMVHLSSTGRFILGLVLCLYLCVLMGVSIIATKKIENEEDYLVAGRNLPLFLCWGTLIATWFGAASMTAASSSARDGGLLGVILDPFACSVTLVLAGLFFAGPMWRLKLLTMGDFFRRAFGTKAELVGCCIQVPSYFSWIALQYNALGDVQAHYFGINKGVGVVLAFAVTLAYTMIGGMWSVTLTDTLQIVIAFFGLLLLAYSTYSSLGEGSAFVGIDRMIEQTPPEFLTILPPATAAAFLGYVGAWSTGLFGNLPGQDLQQRIFSAKDSKTASQACIWAGMIYLFFGMIPVSLGLISRITDPEATGTILQILAAKYLTEWMAIVFVISFVSIVVSTATSAVLAPATILGHNILGRFPFFRNRGLLLDRTCVLVISLGGLAMAFTGESYMGLLDLALSIALVSLFVPLLMGLYGRPRSQLSAVLPMVLGLACYLSRYLPEKVLFTKPEDYSGEWSQYIGEYVSCCGGLVRDLATVPADLYGLAASFLGYFIAQMLYRNAPTTNDEVLKQAWTIPPEEQSV